jgi:hypothetical protein
MYDIRYANAADRTKRRLVRAQGCHCKCLASNSASQRYVEYRSIEASMHRSTAKLADKHDLEELRAFLSDRTAFPNTHLTTVPSDATQGRILLVMTLPHLTLSKNDLRAIFQSLSKEVCFVADAINSWLGIIFTFVILALPHVVTALKFSRRIPAAVSLVLRDNVHFEDALGRQHSLQFNQFRYWPVFHAFLECVFTDVPGFERVIKGAFILVSEEKHLVRWTDANYDTLISPGCGFKMFIMLDKKDDIYECPRCPMRSLERVSRIERRCRSCGSVILTQMQSIRTLRIRKQRSLSQPPSREAISDLLHYPLILRDERYETQLATFKHVHIGSLQGTEKSDSTIGQLTHRRFGMMTPTTKKVIDAGWNYKHIAS